MTAFNVPQEGSFSELMSDAEGPFARLAASLDLKHQQEEMEEEEQQQDEEEGKAANGGIAEENGAAAKAPQQLQVR